MILKPVEIIKMNLEPEKLMKKNRISISLILRTRRIAKVHV